MENPTCEERKASLRVDFILSVKVEFHSANDTSDAGLLNCRELDQALGFTDIKTEFLLKIRTGKKIQNTLLVQFRQSLYSRLAKYEDTSYSVPLWEDSTMSEVIVECTKEQKGASSIQIRADSRTSMKLALARKAVSSLF